MNDNTPRWGTFSFARGFECPECKTLRELASKGGIHLEHVLSVLQNDGSEEAINLGMEFIELYG